ncbi:MAG: DUF4167 domain-containing protein [Pseudomonadota bacterium]
MRQGQQHRRGRGRNNNNHNNRKHQNPLTRSFESNGPDVKIRGTPSHVAEKYVTLARDALSSGDPVLAENYLQHAEHYNRIIMAYREQQAAQQAEQNSRQRNDDGDADGEGQINGRGDRGRGNGHDHADDGQGGVNGSDAGERPSKASDDEVEGDDGAPSGGRGRGGRSRRGQTRDRAPRERQPREAAAEGEGGEDQPDFLKRPIRRSRKTADADPAEQPQPELATDESSD